MFWSMVKHGGKGQYVDVILENCCKIFKLQVCPDDIFMLEHSSSYRIECMICMINYAAGRSYMHLLQTEKNNQTDLRLRFEILSSI